MSKDKVIGIIVFPLFPIILIVCYDGEVTLKVNIQKTMESWLDAYWRTK